MIRWPWLYISSYIRGVIMKNRLVCFVVLAIVVLIPHSLSAQTRQLSLRGVVKELVVEMDAGRSESKYFLEVDGEYYPLTTKLDLSSFVNYKVEIFGKLTNNNVRVSDVLPLEEIPEARQKIFPNGMHSFDVESKEDHRLAVFTPAPTEGIRNIGFFGFKFSDDLSEPLSPGQIYNLTLAPDTQGPTLKGLIDKAAGSKFSIAGLVHPEWITIPHTRAFCAASANMYNACTNSAMSLLQDRGVVLSSYKSLTFFYPPIPGSTVGPMATQGVKGDSSVQGKIWVPLTPSAISRLPQILAHELGHNLGFGHSGAMGGDGQVYTVADRGCYMGGSMAMPNIYYRIMAGWVTGKMVTISGPGTYDVYLHPADKVVKGNKGVIIQTRDSNGVQHPDLTFIEARRLLLPYEDFLQNMSYATGAIIRKGLQDMTLAQSVPTVLPTSTNPNPDFNPLQLGGVYTDSTKGLTVQHFPSSISRGMWLRITLNQ